MMSLLLLLLSFGKKKWQVLIRNATRNAPMEDGAITTGYASVWKVTWDSIVERLSAIRSVWTAEAAPRPECAAARTASRVAIAKEVTIFQSLVIYFNIDLFIVHLKRKKGTNWMVKR